MRYTKLRTWIILLSGIICVIIVLNYAEEGRGIYKSAFPVSDTTITKVYPDLYQAISRRNPAQLKPFLTHNSPEIRRQAWRAFANTPVDSPEEFIDMAASQNTDTAWFGISQQQLQAKTLRKLEQMWLQTPSYRSGISRVLGQQGDQQSLEFLIEHLNEQAAGSTPEMGLAVGRLVNRFDVTSEQQASIIQQAFDADSLDATRAYLYGWYRGDESRLSAAAQDTLFNRWRVLGAGVSPELDQYVNEILKERTTGQMVIFYNGEQRLDSEVQLSFELARSLASLKLNDRNALAAKILLTNGNAHVKIQALQSLRDKISAGGDLYNYISGTMLTDKNIADPVWIQALHTASRVDSLLVQKYDSRLESTYRENIYLLPDVLSIYGEVESADEYLQRIEDLVTEGGSRKTMFAIQNLGNYLRNYPAEKYTPGRIELIRNVVFDALQARDRGVAYSTQPILRNERLFQKSDFDRINKYLSAFSLPGDIEVYQAFGTLYKERFEENAKTTIDSLASLGYAPLNRSLSDAGWEVDVLEAEGVGFRLPDWERLWQLGRHPVWTLKTEKGNIEIRLNTLSAPATVSMIDSLSRAGVYDDVPYHRVVPNFVIQGGDFERKDGFGGPDFVIPTEASEKGFVRGAAGIASAGTDTEGSQYFIMHQWKPHLNGSYTRFGIVTDGMDVVDKIMEGDKVLSTSWY